MTRRRDLRLLALLPAATIVISLFTPVSFSKVSAQSGNSFVRRNLISNRYDPADKDSPPNAPIIDPLLVNPWGAAIRTAGRGRHFWLANAGDANVTEYIGDVFDSDGKFISLYQDTLKVVPVDGSPIGQIFNTSDFGFPIRGSLCSDDGANDCKPGDPSYVGEFTGPSKFIVVTEEGKIAAWTEGRVGGKFGRMREFVNVIDNEFAPPGGGRSNARRARSARVPKDSRLTRWIRSVLNGNPRRFASP